MLYEEVLYELAIKADNNFKITIETSPGTIRNKVINNKTILFDDKIDEHLISEIYNYLSKMTHENTIKELLKDMLSNKTIIDYMIINTLFNLLLIGNVYLNNLYKEREEKELIDYLFVISNHVIIQEIIKVNSLLSKKDLEKYTSLFVNKDDKKYIKRNNKDMIENIKELKEVDYDVNMIAIGNRVDELLKKYNYYCLLTGVSNQ